MDVFAGRVKVVSVRGLPYIYDIRSGGLGGPGGPQKADKRNKSS